MTGDFVHRVLKKGQRLSIALAINLARGAEQRPTNSPALFQFGAPLGPEGPRPKMGTSLGYRSYCRKKPKGQ
jgi:hypothetical protein